MAVRTQIYLPEDLYQRLRASASATGKSMAEQIRESLELYLTESEAATPKPEDPIWQLAGRTTSVDGDLSENHDRYLYRKDQKK
ncbi:MAG: CopG family transcriptional regulator [Syntrophomonadaceae bacterium]|nr:CopG family transcriptional regulator [Syntrophomonadaceae bacterium]